MGFAARLTTTGDNDPEISPIQYYRHYAYCDACASFRLKRWTEPADHVRLEWLSRRLRSSAWLGLVAIVVLPFAPGLWPLVLLLVVVPWALSATIGRRIREPGLLCADCGATYEWRSAFFANRKANPRSIEAGAIPPDIWSDSDGISHSAYWERGNSVDTPLETRRANAG